MVLAGVFLCLWTLLILCRGTPSGDVLHRFMVELPAERLSRIGRGHVIAAGVTVTVIVALLLTGGDDMTRALGMGLPDLAAWLSTVEFSAVVDALVATVTALSVARIGTIGGALSGVARAIRPGHARSRRRRVTGKSADNDDDARPIARLVA